MKRRCTGARLEGKGLLTGFRFLINSRGVASIAKGLDAQVHGLLWSLTEEDLKRLDGYEGVQEGLYARTTTSILVGNESLPAWVYIASDNTKGQPRPGYLERIVAAARAAGLPESYVQELENAA